MTSPGLAPVRSPSGVRTLIGPEVVAALIVLILAVAGVIAVNLPADGRAAPTATSPAAGPDVSPSEVVTSPPGAPSPSASAGADASATASGAVGGVVATPGPASTPRLAPWAPLAGVVLAAGDRILDAGDVLAGQVTDGAPADEIARTLRSMNTDLLSGIDAAASVERGGGPTDLMTRLRATLGRALEVNLQTLRRSIQDLAGYRVGAGAAVEAVAPLREHLRELADVAGSPDPYPAESSAAP